MSTVDSKNISEHGEPDDNIKEYLPSIQGDSVLND